MEEVLGIKYPDIQKDGVYVKFVKTDDKAVLPTRSHDDVIDNGILYAGSADSGYDIYGIEDTCIPAHSSAVVPTGIQVGYITHGFWFKIESRSGLSFKYNILAHPGIIDNPYRGDLGVMLYNHGDQDYHVKAGDRIAQMVLYPIINPTIEWVDEIVPSNRGENGLGSTGKH